jgi:hypothetical protein
MAQSRRARCTLAAMLTAALSLGGVADAQKAGEGKKPSISLKAQPLAGFAPLKVRVTVEVKGGANDYAEYYCPTVEWDWGDDLKSENAVDCLPYEAGKSEINRRYTAEHTYRYEGSYRLVLRLKQKDRVVASSGATVEVRPGLRDAFDN